MITDQKLRQKQAMACAYAELADEIADNEGSIRPGFEHNGHV
jgi:hypothetical protein